MEENNKQVKDDPTGIIESIKDEIIRKEPLERQNTILLVTLWILIITFIVDIILRWVYRV